MNRLGSTRNVDARASIETVIAFLERPKPARCCRGVKKQQVGDLNGQILELVRADSELKALDVLLQSVPGVGPVVSATLLSSLPELGFAATSRLSALVGVAPMNHERPKPVRCWFRVNTRSLRIKPHQHEISSRTPTSSPSLREDSVAHVFVPVATNSQHPPPTAPNASESTPKPPPTRLTINS